MKVSQKAQGAASCHYAADMRYTLKAIPRVLIGCRFAVMSPGLAIKRVMGSAASKGQVWVRAEGVFIHEHVRDRESETQSVCARHTQN